MIENLETYIEKNLLTLWPQRDPRSDVKLGQLKQMWMDKSKQDEETDS